MTTLAIVHGSVLTSTLDGPGEGPRPATVLVEDGKIVDVRDPSESFQAEHVFDADGMLVLPGAIDVHFHCRDPSFPHRGDFASESRAAAAGGVTSIFEMPISKPCASTVEVWSQRREIAAAKAYVNIGLYAAPGRKDPEEIRGMAAAGAIGFKLFTTRGAEDREDEFLGLATEGLHDVLEALELVSATGLRCVFHAEEQDLIDLFTARVEEPGEPESDYLRHRRSRPAVVESAAVASLVALAEAIDTPIHIAHVSAGRTVDIIRRAKAAGIPVTAETCPHYLFCTEDDLAQAGPFGKINPPIRGAEDRDALWNGISDGTIDLIATDHAPFSREEKEAARGDILAAPPGHPGVEYLVPLVMSEALNGRITLAKAVDLITGAPARLFHLAPDKGFVRPGSDADLTIYDPRSDRVLRRGEGFSRGADCNLLYDGMTVRGEVRATLVGGKIVFRDGRILGSPGDGAILRPSIPRGAASGREVIRHP